MEEFLRQAWEMLVGRLHGPFAFRFVLQPLVAAFIACRAGLRDARAGRPAYGWAVLTNRLDRHELLRHGWRELTRVFIAAVIIDVIYEVIVFRRIYPGQSLIIAAFLALLPYPFIRGLVNRIGRRSRRSRGKPPEGIPSRTSSRPIARVPPI
jgi:hypothetical protein